MGKNEKFYIVCTKFFTADPTTTSTPAPPPIIIPWPCLSSSMLKTSPQATTPKNCENLYIGGEQRLRHSYLITPSTFAQR